MMMKPEKRPGWREWLNRAGFQLAAILIVSLFVLPLLWMMASSLRQTGLPPPRGVEWFPWPPAWENYVTLFQILPIGRYLWNSLFVAGVGVLFTLGSASLAAYGMAQLPRPARRLLLTLSLGMLLVPSTALWLTRFLIFRWLGWIDSFAALLAPALVGSSPLFVLLLYWAFRRIPQEQFEAARLDGASAWQVYRLVALPQVGPALGTVTMLAFLLYWNDYINPLLYLKSQRNYTLAVGLQQLAQLDRNNWPLLLAGAVVMTLPALIVFILAYRSFQHSILGDASQTADTGDVQANLPKI